jgi:tetratricopeptide (TPR) repeat protein
MPSEAWFRDATWDEADFERRLSRARPWNRLQYLRIKAHALQSTGDPTLLPIAIKLATRVYEQADSDDLEYGSAPEYLAAALTADGQHDRAAILYLEAVERQRTSMTIGDPALSLANMVVENDLTHLYETAFDLIADPEFEEAPFDSHRFEHARLITELAYRLNRRELASKYAEHALMLVKTRTEPEYPRHKQVGLISATERQVRRLEEIARASA